MIIDWFFLLTIVLIGLGAWLAVGLLGALFIGRGIRIADERKSPDPWEAGPGSRLPVRLPTQREGTAPSTVSTRCNLCFPADLGTAAVATRASAGNDRGPRESGVDPAHCAHGRGRGPETEA